MKQIVSESGAAASFGDPAVEGVRSVCELLITHVHLLTMNDERTVYRDGAIAVDRGLITAVGPTRDLVAAFEPVATLDGRGGIAHPGFIDTHVHFMNTARGAYGDTVGLGPGMSIYKRWWGAADDDDEYAASLLTGLELLANGTTCFMEGGTIHEPDVAAKAATELGIRGLLGDPFVWDNGDEPAAEAMARAPRTTARSLAVLGSQLHRNADPDCLVGGHVVLFGNGTASEEVELAAKATADAAGAVLSQHQSFGPGDAGRDDERFGCHPLVHFEKIGVIGDNCTFSHMNHLREDELRPVADSGMSVAWCPAAAMTWGTGATISGQHAALHRRGVNVSLGSDGANSACRFDVGLQGLLGLLTAREKDADRAALAAEDVLEMSTRAGARAAGMLDRIGSIEVGKRADIVLRSTELPEAQPYVDPLQGMVYSTGSKSVDTVIVDGRVVWANGGPTQVEPERVYELARRSAGGMIKRLGLDVTTRWPIVD